MEPGAPFGRGVAETVICLHPIDATGFTGAIGFQRRAASMQDLSGLTIGEGAIRRVLAGQRVIPQRTA